MKRFKKLSNVQIIALGFLCLILLGAGLLMLPISAADGAPTSFYRALFTSVSASCVTGLVVVDTATHWSVFGQAVILLLIQIGGLGFVTVATVFLSFAHKNLGLKNRSLMAESLNSDSLSDISRLTRRILRGALAAEGVGAVLLLFTFVPMFGTGKGIWYAVFHSVSAFCNAGFDLMGEAFGPYASFTAFTGRIPLNVVFMALITFGGLGFFVWGDIARFRFRLRRYSLTSKVVLFSSALLTFGGGALFLLFERRALFAGMPFGRAVTAALFQSVTCRTAGFNTVELSALSQPSVLLSCFLMLVGGSPGSTAGGIKTTTFAVLLLSLVSSMRAKPAPVAFGRTVKQEAVKKAAGVLLFNLSLIFLASLVLGAQGRFRLSDVLFEAFSAMGTVGMTAGITRDLSLLSGSMIMLLMFCGRVGSITLASALLERRAAPRVRCPQEDITIG